MSSPSSRMAKKSAPPPDANAVALDLEASLQTRRCRAPASWESAQGIHKRRFAQAMVADDIISVLAQDVSLALAEHVDDLSTQSHDFRVGMVRVLTRVLRMARERSERVALFNEAVPGFTLLLFKKDPLHLAPSPPARAKKGSGIPVCPPIPEIAAAGQVIAQFVHRTGDRVLTVECDDALFVFFPASDVKKNLKEMGFFYTD